MTTGSGDRAVMLAHSVAMPLVGFGTWQVRGPRGYEALRQALDVGYRLIDTATMYGNEAEVGRAVRDSDLPRQAMCVTTKLPPENAGRVRQTITRSLRALQMDYVDLWLVHWPPRGQATPNTWRQVLDVREEGLARAVGVSNYSTAQIDELIASTGEAPAVNQIRWSPMLYDAKRLAESRERGVALEGYSPLKGMSASGSPRTMQAAAIQVSFAGRGRPRRTAAAVILPQVRDTLSPPCRRTTLPSHCSSLPRRPGPPRP